jgi:hypothetical protein
MRKQVNKEITSNFLQHSIYINRGNVGRFKICTFYEENNLSQWLRVFLVGVIAEKVSVVTGILMP